TGTPAPKRKPRRVRHPETGDLITKEERDEYLRQKEQVSGMVSATTETTAAIVDAVAGEEQALAPAVAAELEDEGFTVRPLGAPKGAAVPLDVAPTQWKPASGEIEIIQGTQLGTSAPHPVVVHADEVEFLDPDAFQKALDATPGAVPAEEVKGDFLGKRYRE